MEARKLREVLKLSNNALCILKAHSTHSDIPVQERRHLYDALCGIPPCLSILSAYSDEEAGARVPAPEVKRRRRTEDGVVPNGCSDLALFHMISCTIQDVLPFLSQLMEPTTHQQQQDAAPSLRISHTARASGGAEVSTRLTGEDTSSRSQSNPVQDPLLAPQGTVEGGWDTVVGCDEAKIALKQCAVLPKIFPQIFLHRRPFQRVLLYGPPGTGKTLLAQAVAAETGQSFFSFSSADLLSKWMGESEKQIQSLFVSAAAADNAILFFDEIDALCRTRGAGDESETSRRIKTQFLLQLQQIPPSITVIAATNVPWEIDSAIRRRFDRTIYVGLPSRDVRRQLMEKALAHGDDALSEEDLNYLLDSTDGFSSCDVRLLVEQALARPLTELVDAAMVRLASNEEVLQRAARKLRCRVDEVSTMVQGNTGTSRKSQLCNTTEKEEEEEEGVFFMPCSRADPRALRHVNPSHIPSEQLIWRLATREDFDECLRRFIPTVTPESVSAYEAWGKK